MTLSAGLFTARRGRPICRRRSLVCCRKGSTGKNGPAQLAPDKAMSGLPVWGGVSDPLIFGADPPGRNGSADHVLLSGSWTRFIDHPRPV